MGKEHHLSSSSRTPLLHNRFVLSEEPPVFKSYAAGSADGAYLDKDRTGCVFLYFSGRHFGVDDLVPASLVIGGAASPNVTAGEFVHRQMFRDYGYHKEEWPALAWQFLSKHSLILVVSSTTRDRHADQQSQGTDTVG